MYGKGYFLHTGIQDVIHMPSIPVEDSSDMTSYGDSNILDLIFSADPVTGWPMSSVGAYLSDKTNDEVRTYIERNLLREFEGNSISSEMKESLSKVDTDFLVQCSRNRFETSDQYEQRLSQLLSDMETTEKNQQFLKQFVNKTKELYGNKSE